MFAANSLQTTTMNSASTAEQIKKTALGLFTAELRKAQRNKFAAMLTGKNRRLQDLKMQRLNALEKSLSFVGVRTIAIETIRGSEGRTNDFDLDFHPLSERTRGRWLRIAEMMLRGDTLPPVDLVQVEDTYFVRDGHHRISVARALGQKFIDAVVTSL